MKCKIKYLDLKKQYDSIEKELNFKVKKIFKNSSFILRDDVKNFEKAICKLLNVKYCIGLNSGTDALLMALSQINLKKNDEIITVSHTYIASVSSIVHVGAKPVYVDIGDDFNIDPSLIEKKITNRTKAILIVHLNGRCCKMDKITEIAKKYKLPIIEDCAQSLGSKFKNKFSGTFGLVGAFSLHPMKSLSVPGDGGFVVTNNQKVYKNISLLRDHGRERKKNKYKCFGFNSRLDNLHASIALVKIKKFNKWVQRRRRIAKIYNKNLNKIKDLSLPNFDGQYHFDTFNSYVIVASKRNKLRSYLLNKGIEVFSHIDKGVHLEKFSPSGIKLIQTEKIEKKILSLPIYPELKDKEIAYIIDCIKDFYEKK